MAAVTLTTLSIFTGAFEVVFCAQMSAEHLRHGVPIVVAGLLVPRVEVFQRFFEGRIVGFLGCWSGLEPFGLTWAISTWAAVAIFVTILVKITGGSI